MQNNGRTNERQCFVPTPFAHVILTDEVGVILDLHRDEFLGLSKVARHLWIQIAAGKTPLEIMPLLEMQYEAEPALLWTDMMQFIHMMEERGLLERYDKGGQGWHEPSKTITLEPYLQESAAFPLLIRDSRLWQKPELHEAFITLQYVDELMKHVGLHTFASALMDLPVHKNITAEDADVQRLADIVMEAADWFPFEAACLHQYLALAWMLRRRQMHADVVIGMYTHPFSAHAWLESNGHIVQWRAGMGYSADIRRIEAMTVIFHTSTLASLAKETRV